MGVRLIAGRAGSGKTHWCLSQIREALADDPIHGPRLILLVPEQAGLQMERALLSTLPARILGRCEVLNFRRLARRVLSEVPGPMPAVLSSTGRQMALRHLIGANREALREFGRVAQRPGFITALTREIAELLQEAVSVDQLQAAALSAEEANDPSAARLHDVALLYRSYLEYLGSDRVDPDGVMDLARSRLRDVTWLKGAQIWIDGFAGLTRQQMRMLAAMAHQAEHVDLLLLLDPQRRQTRDADAEPDDLSLFARMEQTWAAIARVLHEAGIAIEPPLLLGEAGCPRFARAPDLARLEHTLFTVVSPSDVETSKAATADKPSPDRAQVRLVQATDARQEVDATIRAILDLVQRPNEPMRYRDIAIVLRDLSDYHDILSAALTRNGIPFFIDRRRPTYHHPLVQLVRAAVEMRGNAPFDQTMARMLKTGLTGLADEQADGIENYMLAHGLATATAWDETWEHPVPPYREGRANSPEAKAALDQVVARRDALRKQLGAWWPDARSAQADLTCREWVEALYALLERMNVASQIQTWCDEAVAQGDLDEAEEHEQVWSDFIKLLDELVEILGAEPMTGRRFREVIEAGLSQFTLGLVPATVDQVLVSSIERSRHPPIKALFILGFRNGVFPASASESIVLGDAERAFLENSGVTLARSRVKQILDERSLAYIAVTRPSERLWISYPETDKEGKPTGPSPYWSVLIAALPQVVVERPAVSGPDTICTTQDLAGQIAATTRAWCENRLNADDAAPYLSAYEWVRQATNKQKAIDRTGGDLRLATAAALASLAPIRKVKLTRPQVLRLWPAPHHASVTQLETFAQCPFKHFAQRGLRLNPRAVHEVSGLDLGRIYHTILDQFVHGLIDTGRRLGELTPEEITSQVTQLSKTCLEAYSRDLRLEPVDERRAEWQVHTELPPALNGQLQTLGKSPLMPRATELAFGPAEDDVLPALKIKTTDGETVLLRGQIDRVDTLSTGAETLAVVLDYKRSKNYTGLPLDAVFHGLALQLCTYLLVLQEHGAEHLGAGLTPCGAFYLPLIAGFKSVSHPSEIEGKKGGPFRDFRPVGIFDFDWIDQLDPELAPAKYSDAFKVYKAKDGNLGHTDRSDAVPPGTLPLFLRHMRTKLTELVSAWLAGEIEIFPVVHNKKTSCTYCEYRDVCRFEYLTHRQNRLPHMERTEVTAVLLEREEGADE